MHFYIPERKIPENWSHKLKNDARKFAEAKHADLLLIDGPPGIGCPVTAACQGVDAAIIVSEPTISGIHDLKRVKQVTDFFHIPAFLIINKSDLNPEIREKTDLFFPTAQICPCSARSLMTNALYTLKQLENQSRKAKTYAIAHSFVTIWENIKNKFNL